MRLLFLVATLAMLLLGPLLLGLTRGRPRLARRVDIFVLVCIAALIGFEVLPETVKAGGLWCLLFLGLGLFGPTLLERGLHEARRAAHLGALVLALAGLVLHVLADGTVLAAAEGWALPLAVVLHTLPVGMAAWWLLAPNFGWRTPAAVLVLMAVGTLAGFYFGISLSETLGARPWAWFQALIAGTILHVVYGRPHLGQADHRH